MNTQQLLNIFNFIPKLQPYVILISALICVISYFVCRLFLKNTFVAKKILIIGTIVVGFLRLTLAIISSVFQRLIWTQKGAFMSSTLTPFLKSFNYIFSYVWMHFLKSTTFTFVGAIGLFFLLKLINKLGHNRFFYEEEYWLAALGCLAVGWPNLILYFFISAFLNVFAHIIAMTLKKEGRISLLYMWPIAMIITIIFGNKLALLTGLIQLKP